VDIALLSRGTELEGSSLPVMNDQTPWVDGDLIRSLLLWNHDGMRIDMHFLLTHDSLPSPLPEYQVRHLVGLLDTPSSPLSGMPMHFHDHLAYLCAAFHIMTTSPPPQQDSTDWGSALYLKLWRWLVHGAVLPFKILPHG
jgi:hypothetical protein